MLAISCSTAAGDETPARTGQPYASTRAPLVLPPGEVGFLSNAYSDTIDVFRMAPLERLASYPVGRVPIDIDGASHLALDKAGGAIYLALPYPQVGASTGPHAEHSSSVRAGYIQKLSVAEFRDLGSVRVDENPADMALSDDGRRLVATHFDLTRATSKGLPPEERKGALVTIDTARHFTNTDIAAPRLRVCRAPHGVVLSPGNGQFAFVACYSDDTIAKVNLDTKEIALQALGPAPNESDTPNIGPYALALSNTASRLAVASTESKDVRIIDAGSLASVGAPIPVGAAAYFPAWSKDETRIFVPTQSPDAVLVLDVAKGQIAAQRSFTQAECERPHSVRVSNDGNRVFVVCEGDRKKNGALLVLDARTLETAARQVTGVYPDRIVTTVGP
jgi:DNA-binding beta-propeller fold protein YncE